MYKRALNAFFLKVHPDFFHDNREQRVTNENAVAQLNELLSWAREYKAGTLRPPPATHIAFTFYQRTSTPQEADGGDDGGVDDSNTGSSSDMDKKRGHGEAGATLLQSSFSLPDNFIPSEANRDAVERAVNKFLRELLRRAGCLDYVAASVAAASDAATATAAEAAVAARDEARSQRRSRTHATPRAAAAAARATRPRSLLDEASETLAVSWAITPTPTLDELMDADQVLFARHLSPLQCAAALHTLRTHLGEMQYARWQAMPLLIDDHFDLAVLTGTLTVPWDCTAAQFVSFLTHNVAAVERCRAAALRFATDVEQLIAELCNTLELDDVLVSCSHRDALTTLRLLHRNRALLHGHGVTALTLEIGTRYATRANGVVVVSHTMTTMHALRAWLRALQPKLPLQKQLYTVTRHLLETTTWHVQQFCDAVQPAQVDAFGENECTYAQRLAWARELYRVAGALAQWDWSEFAFVLVGGGGGEDDEDGVTTGADGGTLDLDWARRRFALPYNFDGDALVRYVEEVHTEAKRTQHTALLRESAARHSVEQGEAAATHARELLLQQEQQAQDGDDGEEEEEQQRYQQSRRATSADATAAATTSSSAAHLHSPHLREYMTSSEGAIDTLTVERPLSHAVTFSSDDEADHQLRWEGFYEQPYVDQMPASDLDDIAHAHLRTNRWHREAAARTVLEELRQTYGKTGRRFDYQKMGDVLGINNAKVQPRGFPVLARGTRSSEL